MKDSETGRGWFVHLAPQPFAGCFDPQGHSLYITAPCISTVWNPVMGKRMCLRTGCLGPFTEAWEGLFCCRCMNLVGLYTVKLCGESLDFITHHLTSMLLAPHFHFSKNYSPKGVGLWSQQNTLVDEGSCLENQAQWWRESTPLSCPLTFAWVLLWVDFPSLLWPTVSSQPNL